MAFGGFALREVPGLWDRFSPFLFLLFQIHIHIHRSTTEVHLLEKMWLFFIRCLPFYKHLDIFINETI